MTSEFIQRFTLRQRIEHVAVMLTFTLLSVTGLPQKFFETGWARFLISLFGGVGGTRLVHRGAGIVFTLLVIWHFGSAFVDVLARKVKLTIVPTLKDFADAIGTLRYYLGMAPKQPTFDRFDYKQKFEYWGLVMGGIIMVASGFLLLYPIFFTQLLPGEIIPAAKMAHSNEGLMAVLTIVIWHMYSAHLNPDVFPIDRSIFTGKISRERMHHEHPLELARIEADRNKPTES